MLDALMLLAAGFFGGSLNTLAGGGSFITFPALLAAGVPPVSANATNTFASCSGYLSGTYALHRELRDYRQELPKTIIVSAVGGLIGAWLLLRIPERSFLTAIPWLMLFATVMFIWGGRLNQFFTKLGEKHQHASLLGGVLLACLFLLIAIYGGFFNAGLGIISLSYLALSGHTDIRAMTALKLLISSIVSLIAIALFAFENAIAWREGLFVLVGTLAGGYLTAQLSRKLSQELVRNVVIAASSLVTLWFFIDIYAR
jgi:uncharacterized membrane protein YfcA